MNDATNNPTQTPKEIATVAIEKLDALRRIAVEDRDNNLAAAKAVILSPAPDEVGLVQSDALASALATAAMHNGKADAFDYMVRAIDRTRIAFNELTANAVGGINNSNWSKENLDAAVETRIENYPTGTHVTAETVVVHVLEDNPGLTEVEPIMWLTRAADALLS